MPGLRLGHWLPFGWVIYDPSYKPVFLTYVEDDSSSNYLSADRRLIRGNSWEAFSKAKYTLLLVVYYSVIFLTGIMIIRRRNHRFVNHSGINIYTMYNTELLSIQTVFRKIEIDDLGTCIICLEKKQEPIREFMEIILRISEKTAHHKQEKINFL